MSNHQLTPFLEQCQELHQRRNQLSRTLKNRMALHGHAISHLEAMAKALQVTPSTLARTLRLEREDPKLLAAAMDWMRANPTPTAPWNP